MSASGLRRAGHTPSLVAGLIHFDVLFLEGAAFRVLIGALAA